MVATLSINVSSRWNSAHTGVIYTTLFAPEHVSTTDLRPYDAFHTILFLLSKQCPPAATITAPVASNYAAN